MYKASTIFFIINKKMIFMFIFERESQSMRGRKTEREEDTESKAGSRLRTVSTEPDMGLELMSREIMT